MSDPASYEGKPELDVPFLNLLAVNARDEQQFVEACQRVFRSGRYILGTETETFETEFARWSGTRHCVAVASGLDALRLTLRAWISLGRLAQDDEVVVPANSFIASALAVTDAGLIVRFADVCPETFNMTVDTLSRALSPRTRAVMPVHLYGRLADMEELRDFCAQRHLLVIEDAAQAHGARIGTKGAGSFGEAGAFSFYPGKNLGALGDAGCVVTDDAALDQRLRALRNYGATRKYEHDFVGHNSRISELQAAFLIVKLRRVDEDNECRRRIAARYGTGIRNPLVTLPAFPRDPARHAWHLYVIRTTARASLVQYLEAHGIETIIHYPRVIHEQPAYARLRVRAETPVALRLQREVLSLPMSPVMTDAEVDRVIEAVSAWVPSQATAEVHSRQANA